MKLKYSCLFLLCLVHFGGFTQSEKEATKMSWKAGLGYAHGLLTENTSTSQVQGFVAVELASIPLSFQLDGFYYLDAYGDRPRFTFNHQVLGGVFYTFGTNKWRPYMGLQAGTAYAQSSEFGYVNASGELVYEEKFNFITSGVAGVNYALNEKISLRLEARYLLGRHNANPNPVYLDEVRAALELVYHF
jgi:outer membrane protein W